MSRRPAPPAPPASLDALRTRVAELAGQLSPRVAAAARDALEHPKEIALNPVAAVAARSGIAASAYIRMAQALGFSGYAQLQALFVEPLHRAAAPSWRERIRHHGGELALDDPADPVQVLRAFSQANIVSLQHLQDEAARLALPKAISLIRGARMVWVLGLRRSFPVAAYLAYALNRVGRPCVQVTGLGGSIAEQARAAGARDLLIAISFPPYAADTLTVCEQLQAAGVRRLAITDSVLSPVARGAAQVLQVDDAELLGFRSLTASMALAQALAMGLAFRERRRRPGAASALDEIDC